MITRRTTQGFFLMRPNPKVNACIRYCIARAQQRSKVKIHSLCFLSNHYHICVSDARGDLPLFTEELNRLIARSLNSHLSRWENFWESGKQTSYVRLETPNDVLAKTLYILTNPTAAWLVARGTEWPGVLLYRAGRYKSVRPDFFFRGSDEKNALPDELYIEITPPPIDGGEGNADAIVKAAVELREKELRLQARQAGRRFLGASAVRTQSIYGTPRKRKPRGQLSPRVACRDRWLRIERLQRLKTFEVEHEAARQRFLHGERDVVFPVGTYRMVKQLGAVCATAT